MFQVRPGGAGEGDPGRRLKLRTRRGRALVISRSGTGGWVESFSSGLATPAPAA